MNYITTILIIILLIGTEFHFIKKIKKSIKTLFNNLPVKLNKFILPSIIIMNLHPFISLFSLFYESITGNTLSFIHETRIYCYLIEYPFWTFFLIVVQSVLFFLIYDLVKLILRFIRIYKINFQQIEAQIILITVLLFIFYIPARIIYDKKVINIREVEFIKKGLPEDLNGYKITFISDVQADYYTNHSKLQKFITKVNLTEPDIVLIAGDLITKSPDYINVSASYIGQIIAKNGIFSCIGDHDYWAYKSDRQRSVREITDALQENNVGMVDDGNLVLNTNNSNIGISFITNTYIRKADEKIVDSLGIHIQSNDFKILLTHQPRQYLVDKAIKYNYDLMLAGHTHGGQITFLLPFFTFSPTLFETKYVKGDFWFNEMLLIVNRGLGMSALPFRYNSSPEIVVITLRSI